MAATVLAGAGGPARFAGRRRRIRGYQLLKKGLDRPSGLDGVWRGDTEGMVKSVEGIYRNGKVELVEPMAEAEGSRVIVT